MNEIEKRKDFYADELNMERMENVLEYVISTLTLKEILKMIREISYDMVRYDDNMKGIIYKRDNYDETMRNQACRLQRLLTTSCDLFGQSVISGRKFEEDYLQKWVDGGYLQLKVKELTGVINELQGERN